MMINKSPDKTFGTDDTRIKSYRSLIPPAVILEEISADYSLVQNIKKHRKEIQDIVAGIDKRLLLVVGPCSIHDPSAAKEYALRLNKLNHDLSLGLKIVMRVYFEKPRTTVGWKGLINDPNLDESFDINTGIRIARTLLRDIASLGLPIGCEFLDTITPQFVADLVSWGAIGARTTESQVHRELASGLSCPVGFKNGTDGSVDIAVDAINAALNEHHFLSVTKQGVAAIVETKGNKFCHVILRGSNKGPNYRESSVKETAEALKKAGLRQRIMIDCSHGNSNKNHKNQPIVIKDLIKQIERGNEQIFGLMIESHLIEGAQQTDVLENLKFGQSITDACIGWEETKDLLVSVNKAVVETRFS